MQILGISGSLRARSSNGSLIEAAGLCAPAGMTVVRCDDIGNLPLFNPDIETESLPSAVEALRAKVGASAGILICSPEYARGVPGAMKNALDWLVGSFEFPDKPVALWNASQRATDADAQLRLILRTMNARLVERASITVPLLGAQRSAAEIVADDRLRDPLVAALEAFQAAISTG